MKINLFLCLGEAFFQQEMQQQLDKDCSDQVLPSPHVQEMEEEDSWVTPLKAS